MPFVSTLPRPLALNFLCVVSLAAVAQGQSFPPPLSSRPPRMTELPADSIRLHVRQLRLRELEQMIQRNDRLSLAAVLSIAHAAVFPRSGDRQAGCRTLDDAMSAIAPGQGDRRAAERSPVSFGTAVLQDSAGVALVDVPVVTSNRQGRRVLSRVRLAYDDSTGTWRRAEGLIAALCTAGEGQP